MPTPEYPKSVASGKSVCPFDYDAFSEEHGDFTLAQMGFAMSLTMVIWNAPGCRVAPSVAIELGADLAWQEYKDVLDCAFWYQSWVYSPWVQAWRAQRAPRLVIPPHVRLLVLERDTDGGRWPIKCEYCGCLCEESYHLDHVLPVAKGGINHPNNLRIACPSCNMRKSAKTYDQFMDEIDAERAP